MSVQGHLRLVTVEVFCFYLLWEVVPTLFVLVFFRQVRTLLWLVAVANLFNCYLGPTHTARIVPPAASGRRKRTHSSPACYHPAGGSHGAASRLGATKVLSVYDRWRSGHIHSRRAVPQRSSSSSWGWWWGWRCCGCPGYHPIQQRARCGSALCDWTGHTGVSGWRHAGTQVRPSFSSCVLALRGAD